MSESQALLLVPSAPAVGLTSVSLGLLRGLERRGLRVGFLKPVRQPRDENAPDRSTAFVRLTTSIDPPEPLSFTVSQKLLAEGRRSELLQAVVGLYRQASEHNDVVVVEGLAATS